MIGEVSQVFGKKHRKDILVTFEDGNTVQYSASQWLAVSVDKSGRYKKTETVAGAQVVGLNKVRTKGALPTPPVGARTSQEKNKRRRSSAARQNAGVVVLPSGGDAVDVRPVPDIPGPPVPKPISGVWSDPEWSLLS